MRFGGLPLQPQHLCDTCNVKLNEPARTPSSGGPKANTRSACCCQRLIQASLPGCHRAWGMMLFVLMAPRQARGVKMPSFVGYMRWSAAVLLPLFALIAMLFL